MPVTVGSKEYIVNDTSVPAGFIAATEGNLPLTSTASHKSALGADSGAAEANSPLPAIIEVTNADYTLEVAGKPLHILRKVNLRVAPAEVVAIVGPSGSGKTSLLMLLAGLEKATGGSVVVAGENLGTKTEDELSLFRRKTLGIVFQSFHLIPSLSALDNVGLAMEIASPGMALAKTREAAAAALTAVGLGDRLHHRPSALSGGEQQRVGLARAMVARPRLLLADEPTGNLDQKTGAKVIELMFDLARSQGTAVVLITHDPGLAQRADRVVTMTQGELTETPKDPA
jgi:putative ABC transport system ATP-binding protein